MSITNPAFPLVINNTEYQAYAFSDKDYEEIVVWIRSKMVEDTRRYCQDQNLLGEERNEMLQAGIRAAAHITWSSEEAWNVLQTMQGTSRLAWHLIRKVIPCADTEKAVRADISCIEKIWEVYAKSLGTPEEGVPPLVKS